MQGADNLRRAGGPYGQEDENTIAHSWKTQRWDAFCLVTPNWQCDLPGHPYDGPEPDGFMRKDEIVVSASGPLSVQAVLDGIRQGRSRVGSTVVTGSGAIGW